MTQWQLTARVVSIYSGGFTGNADPTLLWTKKDNETGKTAWDGLTELAAAGWELVSVTPIIDTVSDTRTRTLMYTFKRPKPEE